MGILDVFGLQYDIPVTMLVSIRHCGAGRLAALHIAVWGSIPRGDQEGLRSRISNNSLYSKYTYVRYQIQSIPCGSKYTIDGDVKPGGFFGSTRNQLAKAGTGFPLHTSSSHIHRSYITPKQKTYTCIHPLHLLVLADTFHRECCPPKYRLYRH